MKFTKRDLVINAAVLFKLKKNIYYYSPSLQKILFCVHKINFVKNSCHSLKQNTDLSIITSLNENINRVESPLSNPQQLSDYSNIPQQFQRKISFCSGI